MSLFEPLNTVCPSCGESVTMMAVGSVNADRRPDLREEILSNSFQRVTCGECNTTFRLQPQFNFLDGARGQWIAAMPAPQMPDHLALEDLASDLYRRSYGVDAPEAARAIGEGLSVRLTFGWPAIREKILAVAEGLDDEILEMMKLAMIRQMPKPPLAQGLELRLTEVSDDTLTFLWMRTDTEAKMGGVNASREMYDAIESDSEGWAATRAKLNNGAFVDMQKLFMGPGRNVA